MFLPDQPSPRIMVAPTGARRSKSDHPQLPITIPEIVAETIACAEAGADALHLHVRDANGRHSLDAELYREALTALDHALPGFPVQITTEAAGIFEVPAQLACIRDVQPKAASISVREMARDPVLAEHVYGLCDEQGTSVQHILYDIDDWRQLGAWQTQGIVRPTQTDVIVVLGRYTPAQDGSVADLEAFGDLMTGANGRVMVCVFGKAEHKVLRAAANLGADLRVGFENNIHRANGTLAASNAESVAKLRSILNLPSASEPAA